jgi:UDPglucose 6-dehydrogenase
MKIGIIGNGFVGRATRIFAKNYFSENNECERLFPDTTTTTPPAKPRTASTATATATATQRATPPFFKRLFFKPISIYIYDIRPEACNPLGITLEDLDRECDILFFCLPTPLNHDGTCYTKILEDTIARCSNPYKIIRSTVPVGFSAKHGCYFMPEFLTEARWENDFRSTNEWIVGIPTGASATITATNTESSISSAAAITNIQRDEFKRRMAKLINRSHKNGSIDSPTIVFCDASEAEMLKLMKNCFLSAKVGLMNEFYDFARAAKVDYNTVVELAKKDARMGTSHYQVPGPDGRRGFGGTCFPKDTHSLYCQMTGHGVVPYIFPAVLSRNDTHDRAEREWSKDVWRTTIPLPSATSKVVVVFSDLSASASASVSAYLADIIHDNLAKQNVVIQVVRDIAPNATDVSLSTHHPNHFIKHQHSAGMPLFFPRVDECYYTEQSMRNNTTTSYDTLREVSCIIDLWNNHEEMILNVVKSREDRNGDGDGENENESGSEGFGNEDEDYDYNYQRRPYSLDYAKIIEEYYHSNLSHTPRRLIIMF